MIAPHPARTIDLADDDRFIRRTWCAERAGWGLIALIVLSAVLGLSGPGWFSSTVRRTGGLDAAFERFPHFRTETSLRVRCDATADEVVRIWMDGDLHGSFDIDRIEPAPLHRTVEGGRVTYAFRALPGEPLEVLLLGAYRRAGRITGSLGVGREQRIDVSVFVFP